MVYSGCGENEAYVNSHAFLSCLRFYTLIVIRCQVVESLKSLDEPLVYFYCNRNEPERRDSTIILQAMVKQLSLRLPGSLPKRVVTEYNKRKDDGFSSGSLEFRECHGLVCSLLDMYPQTTIVIDALDESDPTKRGDLLEGLKMIISTSTSLVKVFLSSRDDSDITLELTDVPNLYIHATENMGDINRFIHREIIYYIKRRKLLRGEVNDELKTQIVSTLLSNANGM